MYNCQTFEYRQIDSVDYMSYRKNAAYLLTRISEWSHICFSDITYNEVIDFFICNYDIEIVYFDKRESCLRNHPSYVNENITSVSPIFLRNVSGFTVTNGKSFKIFLQSFYNQKRMIYTLLHELAHIYFHCTNSNYINLFASMEVDGQYPEEIIPFEDEANVIASFLYLNEPKLIEYLEEGCTFDMILSRQEISRKALHNRLNNFLIYSIGLNPNVALYEFLLPYKKEVFGSTALKHIQYVMARPKKLHYSRTHIR